MTNEYTFVSIFRDNNKIKVLGSERKSDNYRSRYNWFIESAGLSGMQIERKRERKEGWKGGKKKTVPLPIQTRSGDPSLPALMASRASLLAPSSHKNSLIQ